MFVMKFWTFKSLLNIFILKSPNRIQFLSCNKELFKTESRDNWKLGQYIPSKYNASSFNIIFTEQSSIDIAERLISSTLNEEIVSYYPSQLRVMDNANNG